MFNPADASSRIKDEFVDYLSTTFSIADEDYYSQFVEKLHKSGAISKGPLIEINDIFKCGHSIEFLYNNNILSKLFAAIEATKSNIAPYKRKLPVTRPLYLHQEKAIDVITTKKLNAVITTGTGSGKTECFLIPIINELLREKERGTLSKPGVRAILIYPMNALANDQMKRLRELLMFFPDITFGVYNGDTKKEEAEARAQYIDLHSRETCEELRTPLNNEYISRDKMNETPPHILCTNYAMLEHMMLRPDNDRIFTNSNFKFVVLDEAHIYTGATGMETALLLRRLKARIGGESRPQFILTSATLGKKGESERSIINFAENLCGEKFTVESIIFGQREKPIFADNDNLLPIEFFEEISASESTEYTQIFSKYGLSYDNGQDVYANLYECCINSRYYRLLRENPLPPTDIAHFANLLGVSQKQAVSFVHACSIASKNGKSLIDARYHFFIRALEGLYTPLYGNKHIFLERRDKTVCGDIEIAVFERAVCTNCGEFGIVGKIDKVDRINKLLPCSQYDKEIQFFHIEKADISEFEEMDDEEIDITGDIDAEKDKPKQKKYKQYYLCPICGAISEKDDGKPRCGHNDMILISEYTESDGKCLSCQMGKYRRFYIGIEAATGVLATALYEELPSKMIPETSPDGITLEFKGGKQFLSFSDSRSDAAYFAAYLDKSYKEFLRRRGLLQAIKENYEDMLDEPFTLDEFADSIARIFKKHQSFKVDLTQPLSGRELKQISYRNAWMAILTELVYARRRTSLVSLGQIVFEYIGNTPTIVKAMSNKYKIDEETCKNLLDYLAMSFANFGALEIDDDILDADDRKYIFYTAKQKFVVLQKTKTTERQYMSWMARNREGKADSYYPNIRATIVSRVIKSDIKKANEFLKDYFEKWLIDNRNTYRFQRGNGDMYYMPTQNYRVRILGDQSAHWYKCEKCGKVSPHNIDGLCVENGCQGKLQPFDSSKEIVNNHYLNLYNKPEFTSLLIREHTAQLSREEGLQYQTDFEKNHIHALSCSTTFEMGVDVGELETVFLRNVPPTAANYAQRAGRAGRSKNSAAYSLTYAKLSSHDFTFFNEPQKIIVGQIKPPVFRVDNEKIVLRHINAVILSYFFKEHPEFFDNNHTEAFLDNGGYEVLESLIANPTQELLEILEKSIPYADSYQWQKKLIDADDGILYNAVKEYRETVDEINKLIEKFATDKAFDKADSYTKMLNRYRSKQMIDFLVRNNILPKYGFPIDTVELEIARDSKQKHELQLQRDLKMAISEYAPGEKVIADNKMYTSRYIKKSFFHNKMGFYTSYVSKCTNPECAAWNYSLVNPRDKDELIECVSCHRPIAKGSWDEAIEPRGGFIAESKSEEVPMSRPEKIYHSQDAYIGDGKNIDERQFLVNGKTIALRSSENDSIMVTSNTDFYVCGHCGFTYGFHDVIRDESGKKDKDVAKSISKQATYITVKKSHYNSYGYICDNKILYARKLNHVYKTDVVVLDFGEYNGDADTMYSTMYAILHAMSDVLGIDSNDIGGCLNGLLNKRNGGLAFSIVLFDTVAGGAGHVRRLLDANVFASVINAACGRMDSCKCDTSCYNCLRNYSNQRFHEQLDRHKAFDFLSPYKGHTSEVIALQVNGSKKLRLLNKGLNVKTETYRFIISELGLALQEEKKLETFFLDEQIEKPDYNECEFQVDGVEGYADLVWLDKKIMIFCVDNENSFNLANQTNYKCLLLTPDIDIKVLKKLFA